MKRFITTTAAAAILVAGAGAIYQAGAASVPTINACVAKANGTAQGVKHLKGEVRIAATCYSWETRKTWNITGPRGPVGPQGPVGPTGPAAPTSTPTSDPNVLTWNFNQAGFPNTEGSNGTQVNGPTIPNGKTLTMKSFTHNADLTGCSAGANVTPRWFTEASDGSGYGEALVVNDAETPAEMQQAAGSSTKILIDLRCTRSTMPGIAGTMTYTLS